MLSMDTIAESRRRHLVSKESIGAIARDLKLFGPTVRRHCRTQRDPAYRRDKQRAPRLGAFQETLETWLRTERLLPKAQRRSARRLFEGLQAEGFRGAYGSVQRFVQRWKAAKSGSSHPCLCPVVASGCGRPMYGAIELREGVVAFEPPL